MFYIIFMVAVVWFVKDLKKRRICFFVATVFEMTVPFAMEYPLRTSILLAAFYLLLGVLAFKLFGKERTSK